MAEGNVLRVTGGLWDAQACAVVESNRLWAMGQYYGYRAEYLRQMGTECPIRSFCDVGGAAGIGDVESAQGASLHGCCVSGCDGVVPGVRQSGAGAGIGKAFLFEGRDVLGDAGVACGGGIGKCQHSCGSLGLGQENGGGRSIHSRDTAGGPSGFEGGQESMRAEELAAGVCGQSIEAGIGVSSVPVGAGPNWLRNCERRKKKKENKEKKKKLKESRAGVGDELRAPGVSSRGFVSSLSGEQRERLLASRAAMMESQNRLLQEKAIRELEVLKANDVNEEVKRYRTKVSAATERNMVSIEKTHAMLRATGNVPGDVGGFANTVLSDDGCPSLEPGKGSVSPDSSASQAEVRAMQKRNLDLQDKYDKLLAGIEKIGLTERILPFVGKELWSVDSDGAFLEKSQSLFDEVYPKGFVVDPNIFIVDGKPKLRILG